VLPSWLAGVVVDAAGRQAVGPADCVCKFVQAKDLDVLKSWKSSVSDKLDGLMKENEAMRRVPFLSSGFGLHGVVGGLIGICCWVQVELRGDARSAGDAAEQGAGSAVAVLERALAP
jgi:hypothetical protein